MESLSKSEIIDNLRIDLLKLQGFKQPSGISKNTGLGPIAKAFPRSTFPLGAVHEFLSSSQETVASTTGFVAGVISSIVGQDGAALWVCRSRSIFPPALKFFGIDPDHIVFIDLKNDKQSIWALDEALKCKALSVVVGEVNDVDFKMSRRFQLSVEKSQATGFIIRNNPRQVTANAFVSRWRVAPLVSESLELPGVGFPKWKVELLRMRNGKEGVWEVQWINDQFVISEIKENVFMETQLRAG
jgi:protein ImuA